MTIIQSKTVVIFFVTQIFILSKTLAFTLFQVKKMDWKSRLDSEEYRNWVSVGHALSLLCDGVRPYIERTMKTFYGQLQVAVGPGTKCLCVHTPSRRPNLWQDMIHCRWAAAIQNYYAENPRKIAWHQSNYNMWDDTGAGPWEIAKLLMSDLGPNGHLVVDAQSTDPTGLINLMLWCGCLGCNSTWLICEGYKEYEVGSCAEIEANQRG